MLSSPKYQYFYCLFPKTFLLLGREYHLQKLEVASITVVLRRWCQASLAVPHLCSSLWTISHILRKSIFSSMFCIWLYQAYFHIYDSSKQFRHVHSVVWVSRVDFFWSARSFPNKWESRFSTEKSTTSRFCTPSIPLFWWWMLVWKGVHVLFY